MIKKFAIFEEKDELTFSYNEMLAMVEGISLAMKNDPRLAPYVDVEEELMGFNEEYKNYDKPITNHYNEIDREDCIDWTFSINAPLTKQRRYSIKGFEDILAALKELATKYDFFLEGFQPFDEDHGEGFYFDLGMTKETLEHFRYLMGAKRTGIV